MIDRIKHLMEAKGLSSTQFADGVEVPRAVVSHILSGRNNPSLDVMIKILSAHRDVSMHWLLLGEGGMYSAASAPATTATNILPPEVPVEQPSVRMGYEPDGRGKVQKGNQVESHKDAPVPVTKTIERIVYFYSDKTFETYTPD